MVMGIMLIIMSMRSVVERTHIEQLEKQLQAIGSGQVDTQIMFDRQIQKQAREALITNAKRKRPYCFGQAKIMNYTGSEARCADYWDCLLR